MNGNATPRYNRDPVCEVLLKAKASATFKTREGETPLWIAARCVNAQTRLWGSSSSSSRSVCACVRACMRACMRWLVDSGRSLHDVACRCRCATSGVTQAVVLCSDRQCKEACNVAAVSVGFYQTHVGSSALITHTLQVRPHPDGARAGEGGAALHRHEGPGGLRRR
jgi:hypothetical protein